MLRFFTRKKETPASLIATDKQPAAHRFHKLKVSDVRRETSDAVSIAFEIPEELQSLYKFIPGQYLTLRCDIHGTDARRSYSICSFPIDGEVRVAIKEVQGGLFSTWANRELKPGMEIDAMPPMGHFTLSPEATKTGNYVGFAAGSGITPLMSIMKSVLEIEPNSKFTLFYGNKSSSSIIFKELIEDLKDQYLNRIEVHHVLSREDQGSDLMKGRIDADKVVKFADSFFDINEVDEFFLCGPETMIHGASEALEKLGVKKEKVHFELFTTSTPAEPTQAAKEINQSAEVISEVTVILDGDETHFSISSKGNTILDSALDAGADVPFACKGAVCCTCRAKVLEGTAKMEMNYALTDGEVEEGYILTCQSHPTSAKVVVSFDE